MRFVQILAILCLLGVPCTVALNIYHKEGVPQSSHDQAQGLHTQFSNLKDGSRFQTIVIGGGIAGVAAAVQLAKSGQHVAILEGKKYLGGRLKTTPIRLFDGGTLQFDEGASWIHGSSEQNPITKLSESVQGRVIKQTDDKKVDVYGEDGSNIQAEVDKAWSVYENLLAKCENEPSTRSMYSVFEKDGVITDKYFMYHVASDIEFQTSAPIKKLAANGIDDSQFDGKEQLVLSGYQRFVDALVSQANVEVYLKYKVQSVKWIGNENQIVCKNGITVYAKNVVVAIPLGPLKLKQIWFEPSLPIEKFKAIQSIGFGNICKIHININSFRQDFTDSQNDYIGVVSDDISKRGLATYFLNLKAITGKSNFITFAIGDNANQAEKMSESQLKKILVKRISAIAKWQVKHHDFEIFRTEWGSDPSFFGAYSYASTETRPQHWQNVAKPVFQSNWYFCGEHTNSKYRGTVHGAYLSGVSTAKVIIDKIGEEDWKYAHAA